MDSNADAHRHAYAYPHSYSYAHANASDGPRPASADKFPQIRVHRDEHHNAMDASNRGSVGIPDSLSQGRDGRVVYAHQGNEFLDVQDDHGPCLQRVVPDDYQNRANHERRDAMGAVDLGL